MWGRGGIRGGRASWRCSGWRWGRKGRVLIDGGGGRHCYRRKLHEPYPGDRNHLRRRCTGFNRGQRDSCQYFDYGRTASCRLMVNSRRGRIFDYRKRGGRMKDHGGGGTRSRGPRAFFYLTRENQVQRCQHTCKSNSASRLSPEHKHSAKPARKHRRRKDGGRY